MSGRHPNGGKPDTYPICHDGIAGTPDGKQKYDPEWLHLSAPGCPIQKLRTKNTADYLPGSTRHEVEMKKLLEAQASVRNRPARQSGWVYGCVSVQRRDNWSCRGTRTFPLPLGCRALSPH